MAAGRWRLPAFADDPRLRLGLGTLLYLAQGFPQGVVFYAIPTWLAVKGQSTAVVGAAAAAASLPWMLKFAAGALMDRYSWLPMGRRRPWLVGSQLLIALSFLLFAILSPPPGATTFVIGMCLLISALTAIQDTALDALVIDLTPDGEMGRLNGFMFGGKMFGIAGGMAVTGWMMQHHGISAAMLAMLALFAVPALAAVLVRERPGEKLLPWTRGRASPATRRDAPEAWLPVLRSALAALLRRDTLLVIALLVIYGTSQTLYETGGTLFAVRQLGWGEGENGVLGGVGNVVMGVASLLLGGPVIDRIGPRLSALLSGAASLVTIGWLVAMPGWWDSPAFYVLWYFVSGLTTTMFYLTFLVLAMRVSTAEAAATSFALIMATHALGTTLGGWLLAPLEARDGFPGIFGAAAGLILLAGLLPLLASRRVGDPLGAAGGASFDQPAAA